MLGGQVTQKLPEMKIIRTQPSNYKVPKVQMKNTSSTDTTEISVNEYENVLGAAFLQLPG